MSRHSYTPVVPGDDARDATVVNTLFSDLVTVSTDIDGINVRREGIDPYVCAAELAHRTDGTYRRATANSASLVNVALAQLSLGGYAMRITGPFTIASGEVGRIRAAFAAWTDATGGPLWGIPPNRQVEGVLVYQESGGAPTPTTITNSNRVRGSVAVAGDGANGFFRLIGRLPAATYDWVEIQTRLVGGAGTYQIGYASLDMLVLPGAA